LWRRVRRTSVDAAAPADANSNSYADTHTDAYTYGNCD
jgi:hypothetical protein